MEKYYQVEDLKVIAVKAESFPDGIRDAYDKLKNRISPVKDPSIYGLSKPDESGSIQYYAAAGPVNEAEGKESDLLTITSGVYYMKEIKCTDDSSIFKNTFEELTRQRNIDLTSWCVEKYEGDRVKCMIRMNVEKEVLDELGEVSSEFISELEKRSEDELNRSNSTGSWSPAQTGRHIQKSIKGFDSFLENNSVDTDRKPFEMMKKLEEIFLNYDFKAKAPDFINPENIRFEKRWLIDDLRQSFNKIAEAGSRLDLSLVCPGFTLPGMPMMTRLEWIYFVCCHTRRHLRQVRNS